MKAIARRLARLLDDLGTGVLVVFYVVGVAVGWVAVAVVAVGRAVRLGWSDARKRGGHGLA